MYLQNLLRLKPLGLLLLIAFTVFSCQKKEETLDQLATQTEPSEPTITAQSRSSEPRDPRTTFEDYAPEEAEIGALIQNFAQQVQSGTEGEISLSEAVWHSEAFINASFTGDNKPVTEFETIAAEINLSAGPNSTPDRPTVVLSELSPNLLATSATIQGYLNSGLTLAIADVVATYDEATGGAMLAFSLLMAISVYPDCASANIPALDSNDDWYARTPDNSFSFAGTCPAPSSTPRGIRNAEERLEELFNKDYCPGAACMGPVGCSLLRTVYTGVVSFTVNPTNLQPYNNGSLYHTYNTSQCRDDLQMQTHVNGLNFYQGTGGLLTIGKTFILLDIETHFIANPHLAPFFYQPPFNSDIYQWRPKYTFATKTCIC